MKRELPKIETITKSIVIPSTRQSVLFRPYAAKEEKILLMAQASDEASREDVQTNALYTILTNCSLDALNPAILPWFDLEYLLLQLRALSVGSEAKVSLICQHRADGDQICGHTQTYTVNLETIEVVTHPDHTPAIVLRDGVGVKMKYPRLDDLRSVGHDPESMHDVSMMTEQVYAFMRSLITQVFTPTDVYDATDYTVEELDNFLGQFRVQEFDSIYQFFRTMPKLEYTLTFACDQCGTTGPVTFRGIRDFLAFASVTTPSKTTS